MSRDYLHEATVEPYLGTGAYGDTYGPAVTVPCYHEGRRELVRDEDGAEVVSEGRMFCELRDDVTARSKVSVGGRDTYAIAVARRDDGGPLAHLEVALA